MRAILESYEDDDVTVTFLRQLLISRYGYMREQEVYETVQKWARGRTQALSFLSSLENGASDYAAILNHEHDKWNSYPLSTHRAISALTLVRMRPMRPLMLSVARGFSEQEADVAFPGLDQP